MNFLLRVLGGREILYRPDAGFARFRGQQLGDIGVFNDRFDLAIQIILSQCLFRQSEYRYQQKGSRQNSKRHRRILDSFDQHCPFGSPSARLGEPGSLSKPFLGHGSLWKPPISAIRWPPGGHGAPAAQGIARPFPSADQG
jgi:hypothetical protein